MDTARFVHDENIRAFRIKLKSETNPAEIERLNALIRREEEIYQEALEEPQKIGPRRA